LKVLISRNLEILGDLKKADDPQTARAKVQELANKLVPACSTVNVEFRQLVLGEMSGHNIELKGVPVLGGAKPVISEGGKKGVVFERKAEDAALLRWQAGAFHDAEALLADDWRRTTHAIDLEAMHRELRKEYSARLKLATFDEVASHVDCLMKNHFHLQVETRQANLKEAMQRLLSGYAVRFNLRHRRAGPLKCVHQ
jgi:hypothetical protein